MSEIQNNLQAAFFQQATVETDNIAVLAEDLPQGGGISWDKIFFEPQVGESWTIKFVTNIFGQQITHRQVYKTLPDPKRRGKSFHYVSSGSVKTCKVLELFFDLYADKKNGNPLAEQKIDKYLTRANQACVIIQILNGPKPELINQFRLFTFSTFGPNPEIANLIKKKLTPDEELIKLGTKPENIFDVFSSSILMIKCEEAEFEGRKGRAYGKSNWAEGIKKGVRVPIKNEDGSIKEYVELTNEMVNRDEKGNPISVKPEFQNVFNALLEALKTDELSVYNYFEYKTPDDPRNTEETNQYLKDVFAKVDEIVPVIKNAKSIAEIESYGVAESNDNKDSATIISGKSKSDILKDSVPEELSGLVTEDAPKSNPVLQPKQSVSDDDLLDDIVNS